MSALSERWASMEKRQRAVAGGLLAALVAGVFFVVLSLGGGEAPEPFSAPTPRGRVTVTPSPRATASPVPETFDSFEGKDPFRPLVSAGGTGGTPAPGGGTPAPSPGATPPDSGGPSGQRVTLIEINTQNGTRFATVDVNDVNYTVKEGDTFAGSYRVLDLTARCGTFVFGDERFTLCVGQEVLK